MDPLLIKTRRDANGQSVDVRLEYEVKRMRTNSGPRLKTYLSVDFWQRIRDDCNFQHVGFSGVQQLSPDADIGDSLLEALALATVESMAERDTGPFVSHLTYCPPLSKHDLQALLLSSLEGPRVIKSQHSAMILLTLNHIGKNELHLRYPGLWNAIKEPSEVLLAEDWKTTQCGGYDRESWIARNEYSLACFCRTEKCEELDAEVAALEEMNAQQNQDCTEARCSLGPTSLVKLAEVISTNIGATLFELEAKDYHYKCYKDGVDTAIAKLMYNDWPPEEVDAYYVERRKDMANLKRLGVTIAGKFTSEFPCFGETVIARCSTGDDDFRERLKNGAKRHAISTTSWSELRGRSCCTAATP